MGLQYVCIPLSKHSGFAPDREYGTWERDHAVDLLRSTKGCGYDLVARREVNAGNSLSDGCTAHSFRNPSESSNKPWHKACVNVT